MLEAGVNFKSLKGKLVMSVWCHKWKRNYTLHFQMKKEVCDI